MTALTMICSDSSCCNVTSSNNANDLRQDACRKIKPEAYIFISSKLVCFIAFAGKIQNVNCMCKSYA